MSKLQILTYPNKFLLQPTAPLENIDGQVQALIDSMAETMYSAPGVGLASIQVGWDRSVLIYDVTARDERRGLHVLINPRIISSEGERGAIACAERSRAAVPQVVRRPGRFH